MAITEQQLKAAEEQMQAVRACGYATAARYDRRRGRIVVELNTGLEMTFPPELAQGLEHADEEALADIQITPSGLGLHWPKLGADLYVPGLMEGLFGSRRWMARELGARGGRARSSAKTDAARANGRKGGRPKKSAAG
ncbi:MAG TPA: DUF2442 domain-containing protein [Sphingomicrobium sp.]|nr:DUF2442 domain-containing protein [Sphingomicrobium sp.]